MCLAAYVSFFYENKIGRRCTESVLKHLRNLYEEMPVNQLRTHSGHCSPDVEFELEGRWDQYEYDSVPRDKVYQVLDFVLAKYRPGLVTDARCAGRRIFDVC